MDSAGPRLALHHVDVFDRDGAAIAEIDHQDGKPDRRLSGGHRQDEEGKDLPDQIAQLVRKGDEIDIDRQYDTFRDKSNRDYLVQQILKAKIDSQINFLKSTDNPEILANIYKLEKSGISEAVSSRHYFDNYSKLIDERFGFKKRNSIQVEKKNATDVINALLNYGYCVLAGQISAYINGD